MMLSDFLKKNITSQAEFIQNNGYGYGQVEPNHLSAQRTAQVYAQLPADPNIDILEQGQFVKYDYANGVVNFTGPGEWMLVFNEIKLYRENQLDCEFAMIKSNYNARVYSPFGGDRAGNPDTVWTKQSRWYNGKDDQGNTAYSFADGEDATYKVATEYDPEAEYFSDDQGTPATVADADAFAAGTFYVIDQPAKAPTTYTYDDVTAAPDMYEIHYNEDPYHIESLYKEAMMPVGTKMVPRVFKTNVGDIFTTNTIGETSVSLGQVLSPRSKDGILSLSGDNSIQWQVVKVYTMPDHQPGVKVMRIA
jgi:hypothetical protein